MYPDGRCQPSPRRRKVGSVEETPGHVEGGGFFRQPQLERCVYSYPLRGKITYEHVMLVLPV